MLPQVSQTWRGSESPGGTRDRTAPPQLEQNFIERSYDAIGRKARPLHGCAGPVDPPGLEAERFRAGGVPSIGGDKTDVLRGNLQLLHRQPVDRRRGLVDL